MSEYAQMLEVVKRAATEAVGAAKPFALTYGTVKTASPLTITADQKLELGPAQLLLTNAVRDYSVEMTVDHWTQDEAEHVHPIRNETEHIHAIHDTYTNGGSCEPTSHTHICNPTTHKHAYTGRKRVVMHFGLQAGEKVLLLRIQGGQQYIVLDRVEVPK